jgi:hypothetical protein
MKMRLYDNKGQERWVSVNTEIPAGWYNGDCEVLNKPHVVKFEKNVNFSTEDLAYRQTLVLEELQ